MAYFRRKTASGFYLDEAISALQKDIRRNNPELAATWAKELLRSGFAHYLWRRLFVIASEDVGPAEDRMAVLVSALHSNAVALTRKTSPSGEELSRQSLQAIHAVVSMCAAKKTRVAAEMDGVLSHRARIGEMPEIPSYALDGHTARGRAQGLRKGSPASLEFWQTHSRVIEPDAEWEGNRWRDELDRIWEEDPRIGFVNLPDDSDAGDE